MRVVAARFPDRDRASTALDRLQRTVAVRPPDIAIAPLGLPGNDGDETLLAGHFPDENLADVVRLVREAGGVIVADVDENWTLPRQEGSGPVGH